MSPRSWTPALLAALVMMTGVRGAHAQAGETSVTLQWTAPGDDSLTGRATRYDLRWSRTAIATLADFNAATPVTNLPVPQTAGAAESATVTGLQPATAYWFALRTEDESGNRSVLSNIMSATTLVSSDITRPAPVALSLVTSDGTSATVGWSDVGDDSLTGTASALELRWSYATISEANYAQAAIAPGAPVPGPAGTPHTLQIVGLDRTRDVYVVARARDDVNRVSALAAPLLVPHLLDTAPPSTPSGLAGALESNGVRVHWAANSEPDLAGYHVYRALSAQGLYARLTTGLAATNEFIDASAPDTVSVWYAVSAVDVTGNESARTAAARVFLQGGDIAAWNVATPYPNPSHVGDPVTLPVSVPASGPYDAIVEIQDAAGQHVRTLRVGERRVLARLVRQP
jgi:chitodextrinase